MLVGNPGPTDGYFGNPDCVGQKNVANENTNEQVGLELKHELIPNVHIGSLNSALRCEDRAPR